MDTLLDRFLRYVKIDTQADEHSQTSPSTAKQWDLCKLLEEECRELRLQDLSIADNGVVMATIPSTVAHQAPMIVWNAHVDTSPEYSGTHVRPIVHENYSGGDIILPCTPTRTITVEENPVLSSLKGTAIITSDGTTLLGADDKAGVAIIMAAAEYLQNHPEIEHGPIRICFTVDEEIGRGVQGLDMEKLGGVCAYTLDSGGSGVVDVETFSADAAVITIKGINTHPSEAKAKGMVNAVRILAQFLARLPTQELAPEVTEDREGFLHPYSIEGGVAEAKARIILRDFEAEKLKDYAALLEGIAEELRNEHPRAQIELQFRKQYRNMREGLKKEPRAVEYALQAIRAAGLEPQKKIIRGGTDGSQMTEKGLPCPNLSSGQHNLHSPLEWASLWEMQKAVEVLVQLAAIWGKDQEKA